MIQIQIPRLRLESDLDHEHDGELIRMTKQDHVITALSGEPGDGLSRRRHVCPRCGTAVLMTVRVLE